MKSTIETLSDAVTGVREDKQLYSFDELLAVPQEDEDCLLEPYLPKIGLGVIAGSPDCGKSLFCRQLTLAVSSGATEFCGLKLNAEHGRAVYVSTEDPLGTARSVISKQAEGLGVLQSSPKLTYFDAADSKAEGILRTLNEEVRKQPVDLIVIDAWGDVFEGKDGNSNMEVRKALHPFYVFSTLQRCCILFIHHVNKSAYGQTPKQGHLQGAAALGQKARVILNLWRDEDDSRLLMATKGNALSDEYKRTPYRLKLDEHTLLFQGEGFSENDNTALERKWDIDWDEVFGSSATLPLSDILERLDVLYPISERTAKRLIPLALVKVRHGVYGRKATQTVEPEEDYVY